MENLNFIGKYEDEEFLTFTLQALVYGKIANLRNLDIETKSDLDLFPIIKNLVKDFMKSHYNNNISNDCIEKYLSKVNFISLVCKCEVIDIDNIQAGTFEKYNMPTILDDDGNEVILDEYLKVWVKLNKHYFDGRYIFILNKG